MNHTHIVKRRKGHQEPYDNHKVYASCFASCLSSHIERHEAEKICEQVMKDIDTWLEGEGTVSSNDIFEEITTSLKKRNEDAAFMYKTHRDIS